MEEVEKHLRTVNWMRENGIKLPVRKQHYRCDAHEAKQDLIRAMEFLLLYEKKELVWLPEYDQVVDWLSDTQGKGLFLYGDCGLGKTLLASQAIPMLFKMYFDEKLDFFPATKLCHTYEKPWADTRYWIDYFLRSGKLNLIIDDVGTEFQLNDYGTKREPFAELMDEAQRRKSLLIITSNLTIDQIESRYGTRTLDRIKQTTRRIKFSGNSLRDRQ